MSSPSEPRLPVDPRATNTTLEFYWDPPTSSGNSAISSYTLTCTNAAIGPFSYPVGTNQTRITGLTNGTFYNFSISATNTNELTGPSSNYIPFAPGSSVPNQPISTIATAVGTTSALVSWSPPSILPDSPINWYVIRSSSSSQSDPVLEATADGTTQRSYFLTGLNNNSVYRFLIEAVNCPGYSPAATTGTIAFYNPGQAKWAAYAAQSTSTMSSSSTTVDSNGNVYVFFQASVSTVSLYNYNGTPTGGGSVPSTLYGTLTLTSGTTCVLVKYNRDGIIQWATSFPESFSSGDVSPVAIDSNGNVYVCGSTRTSITIYQKGTLIGTTITPAVYGTFTYSGNNGTYNVFLVKYNSDGLAQWAVRHNAVNSFYRFPTVAVDSTNNVFLSAVGGGSTTFYSMGAQPTGGGAIGETVYGLVNQPSAYGLILLKYDTNGIIQWISNITNVFPSESSWSGITVDATGNPIVTGFLQPNATMTIQQANGVLAGTVQFTTYGTITVVNSPTGIQGLILVKYNTTNGAGLLATKIQVNPQFFAYLSCDSNNNLYMSFTQGTQAELFSNNGQPTGGGTVPTTSYGVLNSSTACVLCKLNSSFVVQWVTSIRGNINYAGACRADLDGNFYVAVQATASITPQNQNGKTGSTINLTPYGILPYSGGSGSDVYLIKYNTSGAVVWATRIGGTLDDRFPDCAIDNQGNVYVTGVYASNPLTISNYSTAPSPPGTGTVGLVTYGTLPDSTGENMFIIKYAA